MARKQWSGKGEVRKDRNHLEFGPPIRALVKAFGICTGYGRGIGRITSYRGRGLCGQSHRLPSDHAKSDSCDVVPKNRPTQGSSALKARIGVRFFPISFTQQIKLLHRKVGFPSLDGNLY